MLKLSLACVASIAIGVCAEPQHFDAGPNTVLRLTDSVGFVTIEAWEQPSIEVSSSVLSGDATVDSRREGDDVVVTTHGRRLNRARVDYVIRAPKSTRILIDHRSGEVNLIGFASDINVKERDGQINVYVPADAQYSVAAHTRLGGIRSELAGSDRSRLGLRHDFAANTAGATAKMDLRISAGDIVVTRATGPRQ